MTCPNLEDILKDLKRDENKYMTMQPPEITFFFTKATSIDISNETSSQEDFTDCPVTERSNSHADSQEALNKNSVLERHNSEVISEPEVVSSIPEHESLGRITALSTQDLSDILINLNDSEMEVIIPLDLDNRAYTNLQNS